MIPWLRTLTLASLLLYAMVGLLASTCPAVPDENSLHRHHRHHHATHTVSCAWACQIATHAVALDVPQHAAFIWLLIFTPLLPAAPIVSARLVSIAARPPPLSLPL